MDPLEQVSSTDISTLKFAKLHSPKMKSVYWHYFGFPTNEDDRIITKQNVVCTVCHKVLTNHGNTTNLRAHLQHRHKEIFRKVCHENGIKIPQRKTIYKNYKNSNSVQSVKTETRSSRKIKLEYQDIKEEVSNGACIAAEDQAMLYEGMMPMTYEDDEVVDADQFTKVVVGHGTNDAKLSIISDGDVEMKAATNYVIEEMDPYQLQDALVNMIIQDMRNVDSIYDAGMTQFIRSLSGSVTIPSEKRIEDLVKELHSDKLTTLSDQIKVHSQFKPFSLGFEIWINVEQKHFLSIYYNYLTESPEYNLMNHLYCTVEYNKFTVIENIFQEFNLQNCTAAIVSYDYEDYLKQFLQEKKIPIILSYDVIMNNCLRNVFNLPPVVDIVNEVKDVIMRYSSEINSKEVEIPIVNDEFHWTFYEMLKFFSEAVSWPEDVDALVNSAKTVADTLTILAITLDTLKGEEIPHSSMLSPITSKIINKKLAVSENDDALVSSIKTTIVEELEKLVMSDDNLTISALLDPRFHRLTNINNLNNCMQILKDKFNKINEDPEYPTASTNKSSPNKSNATTSTRKSNLELFFDIQESTESTAQQEESNIENDLKRYRNEVYVNLDESPFVWWNKMGYLYGSLRQMTCFYQCIPSVVNMRFKQNIKEQINEHQKRFMLSGKLIDAILFLHYNYKNPI